MDTAGRRALLCDEFLLRSCFFISLLFDRPTIADGPYVLPLSVVIFTGPLNFTDGVAPASKLPASEVGSCKVKARTIDN